MTDFAQLLQQGTAHAWLFVPSAILLGALHGLGARPFQDHDGGLHHRRARQRGAGRLLGLRRPCRTRLVWASRLGGLIRRAIGNESQRTLFPAGLAVSSSASPPGCLADMARQLRPRPSSSRRRAIAIDTATARRAFDLRGRRAAALSHCLRRAARFRRDETRVDELGGRPRQVFAFADAGAALESVDEFPSRTPSARL